MDVSAPGVERFGNQYVVTPTFDATWDGTSFSAPLATGLSALSAIHRPGIRYNMIYFYIRYFTELAGKRRPDDPANPRGIISYYTTLGGI